MQNKSLTSRSAVLTFQTCPRKRFLQYHINGTGVQSGFLNLDLAVGSSVHRGLQHLLEHCRQEHPSGDFNSLCVDEAVEHGRNLWLKMCDDYIIKPKGAETVDFIIYEQMTLIEALIRAFAIYRLPTFLEQYEVLEVEKEEVYEDFSESVTWLGKADGLLRNKLTNELVVLSIKTASQYLEDITLRNILHDMQGVSEIACVENRLDKIYKNFINWWASNADGLKYTYKRFPQYEITEEISLGTLELFLEYYNQGKEEIKPRKVQYEYLIKGQRRKDSDGLYRQQNILVHPYKKDPMMFFTSQMDSYTNESEYKWSVDAGKTPKNWSKINIWEDIGVDEWIRRLSCGEVQPEEGICLGNFIKVPDVVNRNDEEIEEWKISTSFVEIFIAGQLEQMERRKEVFRELLYKFFPKNTQSCHNYYGGDCTFINTCHSNLTIEEGLETGFYKSRFPHHQLEVEEFEKKGFIK
jgi:hypothetical protein